MSTMVGSSSETDENKTREQNQKGSNDTKYTKMENVAAEDVAPVFILQPKEITKNIDLMKTVGMKKN